MSGKCPAHSRVLITRAGKYKSNLRIRTQRIRIIEHTLARYRLVLLHTIRRFSKTLMQFGDIIDHKRQAQTPIGDALCTAFVLLPESGDLRAR